jgi:hypothetical protein
MRIFICTDHDTFWPIPGASVIIATNRVEAKMLLDEALIAIGLKPYQEVPYGLKEIDSQLPAAYILNDGNY